MIRQPGLRAYVWLPLGFNTLFFAGLLYFGGRWFSGIITWLEQWLPEDWALLSQLAWLVFGVLAIFLLAYTFVFVATLIGAPFYSLLAERVLQAKTGEGEYTPLGWRGWLWLVPRTLWRELAKLLNYVPWLLLFAILFFIPVVNVALPFLWVLFSAWMMAFEMLDYPADARGQSIRVLKRRMRRRPDRSMGFGLAVWALTLIPVVNLFVLQAAVAGGVLLWIDLQEDAAAGPGHPPASDGVVPNGQHEMQSRGV